MSKITVLNSDIGTLKIAEEDYICITDIAKYKDDVLANDIIKNWLRNRNTIEFLGIWEQLNNPDFKPVEFDGFKKEAGLNSFTMSASKWINCTNAISLVAKSGRYGGTYAHKDIAFEFASWVSVEFKLYLIKEFQRLKEEELKQLGWDIRRNLTKLNYKIHTDAIKENLIPKEWGEQNKDKKGNIRDEADVNQLVCLANMESLNAHFINEKISQKERLQKLNKIAIEQMKILSRKTIENRVKKV